MTNPLQFSVDFSTQATPRQRAPGEPLRILMLTDIGESCQSRQTPLATRPMRVLDVDALETLLRDEAPELSLAQGAFAPRDVDDFRPDALCNVMPIFQTLKDLRARLKHPTSFDAAAAEVRDLLNVGAATTSDDGASESDTDTFSRLLGSTGNPNTLDAPTTSASFLDTLLKDAVAEHIEAVPNPSADHYIRAVDVAAAAHMRAILHDPAFQKLEAAWRGLDLLASNIETDEELSIHVWNVSKEELNDALGPAEDAVATSVLHRRLIEDRETRAFGLIVSDIAFGIEDMRLLATLGAMAGRSGAACLVEIAPDTLGAASWADIASAAGVPTAVPEGWSALRETPIGQNIAAFGPRFLMRSPYGKRRDPADTFFAFEEVSPSANNAAELLWGSPTLIATLLMAEAFRDDGWSSSLSGYGSFDDLPLVWYDAGGEQELKPCAEVQFTESTAQALVNAGMIPLVAVRNQNAVRIPSFRAIASGTAGRLGPFSI